MASFFLAAWLFASSASAQSSATLKAIDVYRTDALTANQIRDKVGPLLGSYMRLHNDPGHRLVKRLALVKAEIEKKVAAMGNFAYVGLYYAEYFTSAQHNAYITFDIVDAKDKKARMPFRPTPKALLPDPGGLLRAWAQYTALGTSLSMKGELPLDRPDCSAFYCQWGSLTPELAAYEQRFVKGAPMFKKPLKAVIARDADAQKRAAAVYVLSYFTDGREVADAMIEALADPDETVRGAALQVLSDVAVYHKDILLDVAKIIPAVDFPSVSDRSKALAVLVGMQENPIYRPYMLGKATPYLVGLLKLEQPNNQDLAFTLLGLLSRQSFDRHDYMSWENWVTVQQSSFTK